MLFNDCVAVAAETITMFKTVSCDDITFTDTKYFNNVDDYSVVELETREYINFSDLGVDFERLSGNVSVTVSFDYWVDIRVKNAYIDVFATDSEHWNSLNFVLSSSMGYDEYTFASNADNGNFTRTFELKGELEKFGVVSKVSRFAKSKSSGDGYLDVTVGLKNIVFDFTWNAEYEDVVVEDGVLESVYTSTPNSNVSSNKGTLVLDRRFDDVLITRWFKVGTDWSNYDGSVLISGVYDDFSIREEGGYTNIQIDVTLPTTFDFGVSLDPTRLYYVDLDFDNVSLYKNLSDNKSAYWTSRESYLIMQGQEYSCGGLYVTDFLRHTTNASSLQYLSKLSLVFSIKTGYWEHIGNLDSVEVGLLLDNPKLKIYDMGEYDKTDEIVDSIQGGNDLQNESNQLQEEQNETTSNIFGSMSDFFGSFFENLAGIFVPEDGYFEDFFERLNSFFSEKLGMLYTPIDIFVEVLGAIQNSSGDGGGLVFPEVKFQEYVIIERQTINLNNIAGEFDGLQDAIYLGTDVMMIGGVLELLQNKLKEVLKS